jgi:MFS family permease
MQSPAFSRPRFVWVIATLICVHACMAVTRIAGSLWVLHDGRGEAAVGLMLSLFAVGPILFSMWAGRLSDRHGMHRPVGIGLLIGGAGALVAVLVQQWWAIALSCLASGGALAIAAVAIQREAGLLADEPGQLKRVFSWVALGPALSNATSPVIAGFVIDHAGLRAAFAMAVVLPLLSWFAATRVARHPPPPAHAQARSRPAWDLLKLPAVQRLFLLNVVFGACWDAHTFVVPVVGHAQHLSASQIGLVLGCFAAAASGVRLAIARWADHLDEGRSMRTALALAATVFAVYAWLPGASGMMLGSAVLGIALGSVQPMALALLHRATPHERHGQALGLRMLVGNTATLSMPAGFGLLAAATALAAPMWVMTGVLLAAQWPARGLGKD